MRRDAVTKLQEKFSVSERRARSVLDQPRSSQRFAGFQIRLLCLRNLLANTCWKLNLESATKLPFPSFFIK
jgi:hypothetical protein